MSLINGVHSMKIGHKYTDLIIKLFCSFMKEWIMEQWEKNYYISAIAGANNGSSLVIMSKGYS